MEIWADGMADACLGKVMVLSEGIQNVDNTFTVIDGMSMPPILPAGMSTDREKGSSRCFSIRRRTSARAWLGSPTAQRETGRESPAGVSLRPVPSPSRLTDPVVQHDLKAPSMLPGKKGFDRLLYACKNVFPTPLTWLYSYSQGAHLLFTPHQAPLLSYFTEPDADPLQALQPIKFTARPTTSHTLNTSTPPLAALAADLASSRPAFEEAAAELYEWLSLVRLSSPRVEAGDAVDPYLSGYRVPGDDPAPARLRRVSWRGFIPPAWVRDTLAHVLAEAPPESWLSLSATAFGKGGRGGEAECAFFRPPDSGGQYLLWEIRRD